MLCSVSAVYAIHRDNGLSNMRKHLLAIALGGLLAFSFDAQSSQLDEDDLWQEDEWSMDEWDETPRSCLLLRFSM